jgi:methylated-DNA-protein-cysteine methyltransferase-like protein
MTSAKRVLPPRVREPVRSCSHTYQRIWQMVRTIPYGRVATYGQIAAFAGFPRQARLVGYALHNTPAAVAIPWHRVINARGMSSFPRDSEYYRLQLELLSQEGVEFINQRVDLQRFGWRPALDEWLWKPGDG